MKVAVNEPPRTFEAGFEDKVTLSDCARIELSADELVTFVTEAGNEYDVARKSWGFYATPSLNGRLPKHNLRPVLVKNRIGQFFVMLVEKGHEQLFYDYITADKQDVICWLDDAGSLDKIKQLFESALEGNAPTI